MLYLNGRVTGISGILSGALIPSKKDFSWRIYFITGLILGGSGLRIFNPESFLDTIESNWITTVVAGMLVGFGTVLGSGCTSGHGVCGISRFSLRSTVATIIFILAGVLSVFVFKKMGLII